MRYGMLQQRFKEREVANRVEDDGIEEDGMGDDGVEEDVIGDDGVEEGGIE